MEQNERKDLGMGEILITDSQQEKRLVPDPVEVPKESHHRHHHYHHHHSHGSSHRRSGRMRKKIMEAVGRFLKKNYRYLIHCAIAAVVIFGLLLFAGRLDRRRPSKPADTSSGAVTSSAQSEEQKREFVSIRLPFFSQEVSLVGPAVNAYMQADISTEAAVIHDQFRQISNARLDQGLPVVLSYEIDSIPDGYSVKKAEFLVADNPQMDLPKLYPLGEGQTEVEIYYLHTGKTYHYRLRLTLSNDSVTTVDGSFQTAAGPRVLSVEGVGNLRDFGGWATARGGRIKQGLLYRGCELDGVINAKYSISSEGVNTMLTVLGVRTEMDLRSSSDNPDGTNMLGAGVTHTYYNAPMYSHIFELEQREKFGRVFSDLANESAYPIYLHCTHGMDRTGTVCYVLGALLGMSREDLIREYQLSSLYHGEAWYEEEMDAFVDRFNALPGETLADKAQRYLLSVGVTQAEIDIIRSIFLED